MRTSTLIVALLLILVGCNGDSQEKDAEAKKERLEKELQATAQRIQELCSQYNAVMDWTERVERSNGYTIELEEALIRPDSRPVLVLSGVKDITKKSGRYSVHFTCDVTGLDEISLILHCTPEQVGEIMRNELRQYAVIAQVSEVKKVTWILEAEGEIDFGDYPRVSVTLEPDPLSDLFMVRGTCSALLYLGDDRLSLYSLTDLLSAPSIEFGEMWQSLPMDVRRTIRQVHRKYWRRLDEKQRTDIVTAIKQDPNSVFRVRQRLDDAN